jgi:primosomal protein N' (replication factor Y) (superfamily II helicase)
MSAAPPPRPVEVAVFAPAPTTFTYEEPARLAGLTRPGARVLVPFGARRLVGVAIRVGPEAGASRSATGVAAPPREAREIEDLLDAEPVLDRELLDLVLFAADYYRAPPGEAIRSAIPAALHAREHQVLRLTVEGRRVLEAQGALLRSSDDDLSPRERGVLEHLGPRRARGATLRQLQRAGVAGAGIAALLDRGLLAQSARGGRGARTRTDLLVEIVDSEGAAELVRSPGRARSRAALIATLARAGGRARLGTLEGRPRGARALALDLARRGLVRVEDVEIPRDPFAGEPVEVDRPPRLTDEQELALARLVEAGRRGEYAAFLLFGVTGSGKTEVYLRLIADVLSRGRSALVLVPEISLTPQLAARFRARFGRQVAVLHSALTAAERYSQWRLIRSGEVRIVVGARSALFAPLSSIGAVIVDEEHDHSFKQEERFRYNARDLALVRAKGARAVAVLGSATPSLESYAGAERGRLGLLVLAHRATPRPLPEVELVDLRVHRTDAEGVLSAPLAEAIEATLGRGEQTILFLNRRGFSTFILCRVCGHPFRCGRCSVSLTYHRSVERIVCHYCGHAEAVPTRCPDCGAERIGLLGRGTEQVEATLAARFPQARVARLDRDTATGKGLRAILARVARREVDILVGTQMVTKGHDFPHVTLVGVICADLGLHLPDFRASERTFQLLTQVAGRAGRGDRPGRVVVQTFSPEHPSLVLARTHDYVAFYRLELEARRELSYPPCGHLVAVRIEGPDAAAVVAASRALAERARAALPERGVELLGPAEAPIERVKGKTRWLLLLKGTDRASLRRVLDAILGERGAPRGSGPRVLVDVDPLSLL